MRLKNWFKNYNDAIKALKQENRKRLKHAMVKVLNPVTRKTIGWYVGRPFQIVQIKKTKRFEVQG